MSTSWDDERSWGLVWIDDDVFWCCGWCDEEGETVSEKDKDKAAQGLFEHMEKCPKIRAALWSIVRDKN